MNMNAYIDDAVAAIKGNSWDSFQANLKEELSSTQDYSERKFSRDILGLKEEANFRNDFNIDNYIDEASKAKASDTWKEFSREIRRNIFKGGYERSHYQKFMQRLNNAIGTLEETPQDVKAVQSAINSAFTIDGKPMNISDLENARHAVPKYSTSDYARKLSRLKLAEAFERREIIPDGSIRILIDKFEAEKEEGQFINLEALIPEVNLEGYFNKSGLFSGMDSNERREIYNYWEDIHEKHDDFSKLIGDFIKEHNMKVKNWEVEGGGHDVPNYIIKVQHEDIIDTNVPDLFNAVNIFVNEFLHKLGVQLKHSKARVKPIAIRDDEGNIKDHTGDYDEQAAKDTKDDLDFILDEMEDNPMALDPILLVNYMTNKTKTIIKESDFESARKQLRRRGRYLTLDSDLLDAMEKYFDEFVEEIQSIDRENYYLPMNPQLHDKGDIADINESYDNFYEQLTNIILKERSKLPTSGVYVGTGEKGAISVRETPTSADLAPIKEDEKLTLSKEEYKEVLDAIYDYIIEPINSGKYFGEKPAFVTRRWFSELNRMIEDDPFSSMLEMTLETMAIKPSDLDNIADMLDLQSRRAFSRGESVLPIIEKGIEALDNTIGENKENEKLGGHILYLVNKQGELNNKSAESLHDAYRDSPKKGIVYNLLERLLNSYQFRKKLKIKTLGPTEKLSVPQTVPTINIRPSFVSENRQELLKSAKRILKIINEARGSVMTSYDLLMEAHDIIRKMKNKEIIYDCLSLSDVDNVDYILKQVPKYDLNILDLQQIVYELDSFSNIAKSFGIDEESVYTIKGLCRGVY